MPLVEESSEIACRKNRYAQELFGQLPRLLNLLDREPISPAYGSFDRDRWGWGIKDFDNADLQRGVLPLAVAYRSDWKPNLFFQNRRILEWIVAGLNYWTRLQHRRGSFDQWYPGESSVGATAFTLHSVLETMELLQGELPGDLQARVLEAAGRAGHFLLRQEETHAFISNHKAGQAAALRALADSSGDRRFRVEAERLIGEIAERQSSEGWFEEYGGPDPGYETLGLSYLAGYFKRSQDPRVLEMAGRSIRFLLELAHPDGTVGGEYGSRNTELYFPAGLEMFAGQIPESEEAADVLIGGLAAGVPAPSNADQPNFVSLLCNYAAAFLQTPPDRPGQSDLRRRNSVVDFPEAQIFIRRSDRYEAIVGAGKGGALKVFDPKTRRMIHSDAGYFGTLASGRRISHQMLDRSRMVQVQPDRITVTAPFYPVSTETMTPARLIGLRLFSLTLGRFQKIGEMLKRILAKRLIGKPKSVPLTLTRTVLFEEDRVRLEDSIQRTGRLPLVRLEWLSKARTVFMGSSRYWLPRDILIPEGEEVPVTPLFKNGEIKITRKIPTPPSSHSSNGSPDQLLIQKLRQEHITALARIHRQALPEDYLPGLGEKFLEELFLPHLLQSPQAKTIVCLRGDRPVGFIVGCRDSGAYLRQLAAYRPVRLAAHITRASLRDPKIFFKTVETAFLGSSSVENISVELFLIAVKSGEQNKGIGRLLVGYLAEEFSGTEDRFLKVKVACRNTQANRFYEKLGFTLVKTARQHGRLWNWRAVELAQLRGKNR